jgi:hypothetical protein
MRVGIHATTPSRCGLRGGRKEERTRRCGAGVVTSALLGQRPGARGAEFFWERGARENLQVHEATA